MKPPMLVAGMAIVVTVTNADLERAISLGRRPEGERARFHARYAVALEDATVQQIDIVTEFRRAVQMIEERARVGDYMFSVQQLAAALRPVHNQVLVRAKIRFHPLTTLTSVPGYELRVGTPDERLLALAPTANSPIYMQASDGKASSLVGAMLELPFDSGIVGQNRYPISVVLAGKVIATTTFDFGAVD